MSKKYKKAIEQMIDHYENRRRAAEHMLSPLTEALKRLKAQPDDLDDLRAEVARVAAGAAEEGDDSTVEHNGSTVFDEIAECLTQNGNKPMTARELAQGTGESEPSVNSVLRGRYDHHFQKEVMQGYQKRFTWRLTDETYQKRSPPPNGSPSR